MNKDLAELAKTALTASGYEERPGYCWRWIRQVLTNYYGAHRHMPPQGVDAKAACRWYQKHGYTMPKGSVAQVGDLIFWIGPRHGKHGHVAMRILGNRFAENSSLHSGDVGDDARGTRPLPRHWDEVVVVRLPRY